MRSRRSIKNKAHKSKFKYKKRKLGYFSLIFSFGFIVFLLISRQDDIFRVLGAESGAWIPLKEWLYNPYKSTSELLDDGKIVIVGCGSDNEGSNKGCAQIYDPNTNEWVISRSIRGSTEGDPEVFAPWSIVKLLNGQFLVRGTLQNDFTNFYYPHSELYNPTENKWEVTGEPQESNREAEVSTLLSSGSILVTGGFNRSNGNEQILSSTEIYNPNYKEWKYGASMKTARSGHTATMLNNGKVLVAGGYIGYNFLQFTATSSSELYDPVSNTWSVLSPMIDRRQDHSAILLQSGKVLITGGRDGISGKDESLLLSSVEIFDPESRQWTQVASMSTERHLHTSTLLKNGKVIVIGGFNQNGNLSTAEIYDSLTDSWTVLEHNMISPRSGHSASMLKDGRILVAGGNDGAEYPVSIEIFDPDGNSRPQVNLNVEEIKPVQVVDDVDINDDGKIDLVLGKPMVVRVKLGVENLDSFDASKKIKSRLEFQGSRLEEEMSIQEIIDNDFFVDFYHSPRDIGDSSIKVKIDFDGFIDEADEDDNEKNIDITVKDTKKVGINYMKVDCYGAVPGYQETANKSYDTLRTLYPLSPEETLKNVSSVSLRCTESFDRDLVNLMIQGKFINPFSHYTVGIANVDWFNNRGFYNTAGVTKCMTSFQSVFVLDGYPEALSHEAGHVEGLGYPGGDECLYNEGGSLSNGFWVADRKDIKNASSMMDDYKTIGDMWITLGDYEYLFKRFREKANDPRVLLVSGSLHKDGRVEWYPFYTLPEGNLDEPIPGDYLLKILDKDERVLYQKSFTASFKNTAGSNRNLDRDTFGFAVAYPQEAYIVEIEKDNQVLSTTNTAGKLLRDAIKSVPDSGFTKNPTQIRNALLNKVDALDDQLNSKNTKGAYNKLKNDIRKSLESWLRDDYRVINDLEYTKQRILDLVDDLLQRLR